MEAVRDDVEALGPEASWRERIHAAIAAHLRLLLRHGDFTAADIRNYGQLPDQLQRRHLQARTEYGEYWRELLKGAREAGELRADANLSLVRMLVLGALNWSLEWYDAKKLPTDQIADEMWHMLFEGLDPPDRRPQS
jgi:hypothetical protein